MAYYNVRFLTDYFQNQQVIPKFYFIVDRLDLLQQAQREFTARGLIVHLIDSAKPSLAISKQRRRCTTTTAKRKSPSSTSRNSAMTRMSSPPKTTTSTSNACTSSMKSTAATTQRELHGEFKPVGHQRHQNWPDRYASAGHRLQLPRPLRRLHPQILLQRLHRRRLHAAPDPRRDRHQLPNDPATGAKRGGSQNGRCGSQIHLRPSQLC